MAATDSRKYNVADRPQLFVSRRREQVDAVRTVVALRGELDAAALNSLVDEFDDAIANDDSDVVIDLTDVDFIGAAWIGTLVRSRAVLNAQHRALTLRKPPRVIYRLFDLCGLAYLIDPADVPAPASTSTSAS